MRNENIKFSNYGKEISAIDRFENLFIIEEKNKFILARLFIQNDEFYLLPKRTFKDRDEAKNAMNQERVNMV